MKSNKQLLSEALDLLYKVEDNTEYSNTKLGEAINNIQDLLSTIDMPRISGRTIEVGVYYYIDDEGNKVYDEEEMQRELEIKLKELPK